MSSKAKRDKPGCTRDEADIIPKGLIRWLFGCVRHFKIAVGWSIKHISLSQTAAYILQGPLRHSVQSRARHQIVSKIRSQLLDHKVYTEAAHSNLWHLHLEREILPYYMD